MQQTKIKTKKAKLSTTEKKPANKMEQKVTSELQRQMSLTKRVEKVQKKALDQAHAAGHGDDRNTQVLVQEEVNKYMENELIRKAVKDVQRRATDQKKKRQMKERAFSAVKSKVAGNIKMIERVKKTGSPCKPGPGYDPNVFINESLKKPNHKGRPKSSYTHGLPQGQPKISKDYIETDDRYAKLQARLAEERARLGIRDPKELIKGPVRIYHPMTSPPKQQIRDPAKIHYTNVDQSMSISPEKSTGEVNASSQFKGMKNSSILQNTPATQAYTDQKHQSGDISYGQMSNVRNFSIKDAVGDSPSKQSDIEFKVTNDTIQKKPIAQTASQPVQMAAQSATKPRDMGEFQSDPAYQNRFERDSNLKLTKSELVHHFSRSVNQITELVAKGTVRKSESGNVSFMSTRAVQGIDKSSPSYLMEIRLPGLGDKFDALAEVVQDHTMSSKWNPDWESMDKLGVVDQTTLLLDLNQNQSVKRMSFTSSGKLHLYFSSVPDEAVSHLVTRKKKTLAQLNLELTFDMWRIQKSNDDIVIQRLSQVNFGLSESWQIHQVYFEEALEQSQAIHTNLTNILNLV